MFVVSANLFSQTRAETVPTYNHLRKADLPTVNATISWSGVTVNTDDLTIAIATDPQGNAYSLSFGSGISKRDANGNLLNANFIPASQLDNPLDLAVDSEGYIYVADYLASGSGNDNGKIRVFDANGSYLSDRTIFTSFYRPLGLDVDEENVYVAEFNDGNQGPESDQLSRVRIYDKIDKTVVTETDQVLVPFRIAVNSNKDIYVSKTGNNDPGVVILDENLNITGVLPNITSPGSVVIDAFDYVHVVEYAGIVSFSDFINFNNLNIDDLRAIAEDIDMGIRNDEFGIKVFSPNLTFEYFFKDMLDFPVDLSFNSCDRMYVDNSENLGFTFGYPSRLEFDLEIYQRIPSADITPPVASCISAYNIELTPGETKTITANDLDNNSYDLCGNVSLQLSKESFTDVDEGSNLVDLLVTDEQGNTSTCQVNVQVSVQQSTDTEDPVFTFCPSDINLSNDAGQCGAVVNYSQPTATDNSGNVTVVLTAGPAPGAFVNVGSTVTVVYTATDPSGNTTDCSFSINITDEEGPVFTSCPTSISETVAFGETGKVITYADPVFSDNCAGASMVRTAGQASGEEFSLGDTTVTYEVTDATGKKTTCSFTVTITEAADTEDPEFTFCPSDINLSNDAGLCGAVVNYSQPIATDNSGNVTVARTSGPASGAFVDVGSTVTVVYTATDPSGNTKECSFSINVTDEEGPVFTSCPDPISETVAFGETGKVITYADPVFSDNCAGASLVRIAGPASGEEFPLGNTIVTYEVTDAVGKKATCSFIVTIAEAADTEDPEFTFCPSNINLSNDAGLCGAVVNYSQPVATDNSGNVTVALTDGPASGSFVEVGNTVTVVYTATDPSGNNKECSFNITVNDTEDPVINCPEESISLAADSEGNYRVPNFINLITDNCGLATVEQLPPAGTIVNSDTPVSLKAIDGAGNSADCVIQVVLLTQEPSLQITTCPPSRSETLGNDCSFILPDYTREAVANVEATFSQTPVAGTVITAATEVIIKAEASGQTVECSFEISLEDNIIPEISCPSDKTENFDPAIGFTVPDYRDEAIASDNCSFEIVQDPPPGTVLFQSRWIFLTAIDASDNQIVCEFALNLTEGATPEISCKDVTIELDATGKAYLDASSIFDGNFYDPSIRSFSLDNGSFDCSDIGVEVPVVLTVEYMNGATAQCTSKVTVVDNSDPVVNCVSTFTLYLNEEGYGILSPGILDRNSTDNCGIAEMKLSKTRFDNSDVGEQTIVLTVTDTSGNTETCETVLTVVPYGERIVTCAEEIDLPLDENGEATLKLTYTGNEENIEVVTSKTNFTCDDLGSEVVTATYIGEYSGSCEIQINILDNLRPQIDCASSYTLRLNQQGTGTISEELLNLNYSDNCGVSRAVFSKTNFTTQDIGNNDVTFKVNDSSGNESTCTINVMVIPFDYAGPDFECKDSITLELNPNGQAFLSSSDVYTGEALGVVFELSKSMFTCSDIGSQEVELSYSGTATGTCTLEVVVEDNLAPAISCVASLEVYLDQTGSATISPQDIDNGSTDNCSIISRTLSKTNFSEADLGENTITLTVMDGSENISTCEATVIVKPPQGPAPVECVESVVLELNANGRANLDPLQLFSGGSEDLEYSVNRTQFTCLDLGEQNVVFNYSSESDSGSCEIPVIIIDPNSSCEEIVGGNGPFVILYPNPGNGEVSIMVSPGIVLKRAEVFDIKGRFLLEKLFEENSAEDRIYRINLTAFQSGVYTLMLYSQDREYIRRAIIRND